MRCPKCTSDLLPARDGGGFCTQCGELFQASAQSGVHYSRAAEPAVIDFCKHLAARAGWVTSVFDTWPGPLAHEALRLKTILEEGQIIGAIWQLKDLAEVTLKFPAVIMARDLLEHGGDENIKREIRELFFSKPLSMGDWLNLAGNLLTRAVLAEDTKHLTAPGLAGIFRQTTGGQKPTRAYNLIREVIQWRNDELGHGAFRLNVHEFHSELESFVNAFNAVFQEHEELGVWTGLELQIGGPEPVVLRGATSIRTRHANQIPGPHISDDVDVALVCQNRTLVLSPFLSVKRCRVCRKMDVFFFDSKRASHFYFLDYLAGHKMSRPGHLEGVLVQHSRDVRVIGEDVDENETMGQVARRTVDALLLEKSLEADYLSPVFLRKRLKTFIENHDRGIFWLQAPAHCGKSVFVRGLLPSLNVDIPLVEGLKVAAFFIKREYRYHPAQFKEQLREAVTGKDCLNLMAGSRELPELDLRSDDAGSAFAEWLGALLKWRPDDLLLVCLDGLDELIQTEDKSILEFIPKPDQLPERLFILLTSRPQEGCPDWVWEALRPDLNGYTQPNLDGCEVRLNDPEYQALLRTFFFKPLSDQIISRIHLHLKAMLKDNPEFQFSHDTQAAPDIPITLFPGKILKEAGLDGFTSGKKISGIYAVLINPVVTLFEKGFETVLQKADNRFLFVSHQINLLRDASATLETLDRLPCGEGLFRQYLDELKRVFTVQHWEYAKRLLLVLAAAEEAYQADFNRGNQIDDREWNGLPFRAISDLMAEADVGSARLIFVLYSLKEVLITWRKRDGWDTLYRLGIKDFSSVIRVEWSEDLIRLHREIAELFYSAWKDRFEDVNLDHSGEYYCYRYLLAHAELCENAELKDRVWSDGNLADAYGLVAKEYYKLSFNLRASEFRNQEIAIYNYLVNNKQNKSKTDDLAGAYLSRGNELQHQSRYDEAITDYDRAIELRKELRQTLEPFGKWLPAMSNSLAGAYLNRGTVYGYQGRYNDAIADYERSIRLLEELRQTLEFPDERFSSMTKDLAGTYMNRGVIYNDLGRYGKAVTDYGRAIDIMERLREMLEPRGEWLPAMINSLAGAYLNRAVAIKNQSCNNEAIADYDRAIDMMEMLRELLDSRKEWLPRMAKDLASAYGSRGSAYRNQGRYDEAITDHDRAISLGENLRKTLESHGEWPPSMANDLARAYRGRGFTYDEQGLYDEAIADYGLAINLGEKHRQKLESRNEWPPDMASDLAGAYMNRGVALRNIQQADEAISDYNQAIELMEGLRQILEPQGEWPPDMANNLAGAYLNRGVVYDEQGRYDEAIAEYDNAIKLREGLQQTLEPQGEWPPDMAESLAGAYLNRGSVYDERGRYDEAIACYDRAVTIMEDLRQTLESRGDWSPAMANELAGAYGNRGITFKNQDRIYEAIADYSRAIDIREVLAFQKRFPPAIPSAAMVLYNALHLTQKLNDPDISSKIISQAKGFLEKLGRMVNVARLPESWQKELNDLQNLIDKIEGIKQF